MKIIKAWIDDPTLKGTLKPSRMMVEVTENPDVSILPESFSGGWVVGKYGPFVNYSQQGTSPTAGDFNVRFHDRFPVVVDITLLTPEHEIDGYSLPLSRARQLIRKHDGGWRLLVSERAAEAGKIEWTPVQTHPTCRAFGGYGLGTSKPICGKTPARLIRVDGVDLPMCEEHVQLNNQRQAQRRASRSS